MLSALFARAGAESEIQSKVQAILQLITANSKTVIQKYTFAFFDRGFSRQFRTVCKKYGTETCRFKGQRYFTVNIRISKNIKGAIDRNSTTCSINGKN